MSGRVSEKNEYMQCMVSEIALLWDGMTYLQRYLTAKGFESEVVAHPALLLLKRFKIAIVPAGFADRRFSKMLGVLRACRESIENFVQAGGTLIVSGAISEEADAYNWLPFQLKYKHKFGYVRVERVAEHAAAMLVERGMCMCDGYFDVVRGGEIILKGNNCPILVASSVGSGAGEIIATTVHEFPSERFIAYYLRRKH
ncbi:MAG: hypothetical protein OCU16_01930 [Candidatus Methanospirare jalkutatii]|nr:hypothetical protein [Candidatus Methanospirare jalkutatii]